MASSTNKKVMLERFDRLPMAGFVHPFRYLQPQGIELLSTEGNISLVPYDEVRIVSFVRQFQDEPSIRKREFGSRPKLPGLWVRLRFRDGEFLEGILANNLLLMDPYGFELTPPDLRANGQRVFIPRAGVAEAQVVAVINKPQARRQPKRKGPSGAETQLEMFD